MYTNYKAEKEMEAKGFVHAGKTSTLRSKQKKHKMPTTKGYSKKSKVYSPASRSI